VDFHAWVLKGPFSRREAWADLHALREGGVELSVREIAERWRWSKSQVHRFLKMAPEGGPGTAGEGQLGLALPGIPPVEKEGLGTATKAQLWPTFDKLKVHPRNGRRIYPDRFEELWEAYTPDDYKGTKKTSYGHIRKSVLAGVKPETILQGIRFYIAFLNTNDHYPMAAHNFFGQEAWSDYDDYSDDQGPSSNGSGTTARGFYK